MQTPDQYFDTFGWAEHFDFEAVEAAREHFHNLIRRGTVSKAEALERAWSYAQGASRFLSVGGRCAEDSAGPSASTLRSGREDATSATTPNATLGS